MATVLQRTELFRKYVQDVQSGRDLQKFKEILFDPLAKDMVHGVNVSGTWGWFLCICHGGTRILILIGNCCSILRNSKVIYDTSIE